MEITIFTHEGRDNWESRTIRGALLYRGIASTVRDLSLLSESDEDVCVVLPSRRDQLDLKDLWHPGKTRLLVGHYVTLQYLYAAQPIPDNVVVVYGEPYRAIPQFARSSELRGRSRGEAVLGALYDPTEYVAVPGARYAGSSLVVTSLGCEKECAYCTYGCTYSRLYGQGSLRRERPWRNIEDELIASLNQGVDHFQMTASQFLSNDPNENEEIRRLALNWNSETNGRPSVAFTVSPTDVLANRSILEAMSQAFQIYPRLSIDSFDDRALAVFDRDYNAVAVMEALEFFAAMRLPLRVNYIFVHPGIDIASIERQIPYLRQLASTVSYLSVHDRFMLAFDIFSNSLLVHEAAPIAFRKGVQGDYETKIPLEVLTAISGIQGNLEKLIAAVREGVALDPLMLLVETLERDVSRAPWKAQPTVPTVP